MTDAVSIVSFTVLLYKMAFPVLLTNEKVLKDAVVTFLDCSSALAKKNLSY